MIATITKQHGVFDVMVENETEVALLQAAEQIVIILPRWRRHMPKETDLPEWVKEPGWCAFGQGGQFTETGDTFLYTLGSVLHDFVYATDWGKHSLASQLPAGLTEFGESQERWPAMRTELARYVVTRYQELGVVFLTRETLYGPYRLVAREDYE